MILSFRQNFVSKKNIIDRIIDFFLHLVLAATLPYLFRLDWIWGFVQWLPDLMVPLIWIYSMVYDRYLPRYSATLNMHKTLHSFSGLLCAGLALGIVVTSETHLGLFLMLNWVLHLLIDLMTHDNIRKDPDTNGGSII